MGTLHAVPYPITSKHVKYDVILKMLDPPSSTMVSVISLILADS
jgi:hypothetical protein